MTASEISLLFSLDEMEDDDAIRSSKRRTIGKLLEIIKSTPCTFTEAYEKNGKETTIKNANCIDMNIDYSVDSGSDSDINSFIDLVSNLFSGDSFLYLVEEDDDGISVDINSKANDHDSLSSVIGTTWESYKEDREDI